MAVLCREDRGRRLRKVEFVLDVEYFRCEEMTGSGTQGWSTGRYQASCWCCGTCARGPLLCPFRGDAAQFCERVKRNRPSLCHMGVQFVGLHSLCTLLQKSILILLCVCFLMGAVTQFTHVFSF